MICTQIGEKMNALFHVIIQLMQAINIQGSQGIQNS